MNKKLFGPGRQRGSALLAAMIVVTVLSFAAAGILSYSLNTYENTSREQTLDQAREMADSEMEYLYYAWKGALISRTLAIDRIVPTLNQTVTSSTATAPFAIDMQNSVPAWTVSRTIAFNFIGPSTGDGSAEGIVQGNLIGKNYYFTAETAASVTKPLLGTISYHTGRHFAYSSTPLFQYAVFYQGDLELAPGSNMQIKGPISTNSSAYLGSQSGYTLTLTDQVAFFQNYNGAGDPNSGELDLPDSTSTLTDPVYNPDPTLPPPVDQVGQRKLQVDKMPNQASFIGGVDINADVNNPAYANAYTNLQGKVDINEIYRAVVAPPPVDSSGTLYPEDQVVAASRMYNTASIVITINENSSTPIQVGVVDPNHPGLANDSYAGLFPTIVTPGGDPGDNPSTPPTAVLQGVRTKIVDPREALNGTTGVNMTTLDVGNFRTALASAMASNPAFAAAYNGVVYVYDATDNNAAGVPNTQNAIRLTNATTTPDYRDLNGNPLGFTVVSNNGVYVQGDYNTTTITVPGVSTQVTNPTAIMGDAVTVLSQGWGQDANATLQDITNRKATASTGTPDGMTVNAAILTGNTPTTEIVNGGGAPDTVIGSGGAQNLVRMEEDWYSTLPDGHNLTLTLNGSLGQLFNSKYFTGAYAGSGVKTGISSPAVASVSAINRVYMQPPTRVFDYDTNFKQRAPAGAPTTTGFTRGDFFFW
jgi:hypothetical protein